MILYRAVAEAEYQEWQAAGRLRAKLGAMTAENRRVCGEFIYSLHGVDCV